MGTGTSMDINDTALLDAVELLAAFAAKTLSPLQALQGVTERIARKNPEINAFATLNPAALADARESTRRWHAGTARALEGVPVTVCDQLDIAGLPVRDGHIAAQDAPLVRQLRAAGAVILGKTTVFSSDVAPLRGITRNPWNVAHLAGCGAAAAAAGFFGPLHVSVGTSDELFVAASWSGVVGFKASSVPAGIVARTVQDVALLAAVIGQIPDSPTGQTGMREMILGVWQPASCAALDVAQALLPAQGVKLVPLSDPAELGVVDALLCSAGGVSAPLVAQADTVLPAAPWRKSLPAAPVGLTLPVGVGAQGLPLGVLLSAPVGQEAAVLCLAQMLERCVNEL